jgi:hypothetical protein
MSRSTNTTSSPRSLTDPQPQTDTAAENPRPQGLEDPSAQLRYGIGSLVAGGCAGPSISMLPWSSRNGGYRSVINAT